MHTTNKKMKKSNLILLGALGAIIFFSLTFQLSVHSYVRKGKADMIPVEMVKATRNLPSFSGISTKDNIKIIFQQTDLTQLRIEAPNYLIDSISTVVYNEELTISVSKKLRNNDSITIRINNPFLNSLKLGGSSHFETGKKVSGKTLELVFSDESSGILELSYDSVRQNNTSSGTFTIKGDIQEIDLTQNKKQD